VLHDDDAVGDDPDHLHLVRDEHDRHAEFTVDAPQEAEHLLCGVGVEGARGLVGEEDAGLVASARAMPTRCFCPPESCSGRRGPGGEADEVEQLGDAMADLVARPAGDLERVGDVPATVRESKRLNCWKIMPMSARRRRSCRSPSRVMSVPSISTARRRGLEGVDQAQQGGLARPE
jgi:hypothetical protein